MVTVLFADLVDSTGLGQRLDPERAREVLGRFFDAATEELQALRGRPEKFIGDAVMAVFGLPAVHEDDALRAVRAGLAIRGRLRRLGDVPRPAAAARGPRRRRVRRGGGRRRAGRAAPRHRSGRERGGAPADRGRSPARSWSEQTTHALTETAVSYGDRRDVVAKGFDRHARRVPRRGSQHALGPAHDPVRRPLERAHDPAGEPEPRGGDGTARARHGPRRAGHRQVAAGRRARGGARRRGPRAAPAGRARTPTPPRSRRSPRHRRRAGRRSTATSTPDVAKEQRRRLVEGSGAVATPTGSSTGCRCCSASPSGTRSRRSCTTSRPGSSR